MPLPAPSPSAEPPRWAAVKSLFERLIELPAAERRAALAREASDTALAAEVWSLLGQHAAEETLSHRSAARPAFLGRPPSLAGAATGAPGWADGPPPDRSGLRLGPWRLAVLLGHGGMGEVWEAERDDGAYEARVAVKLLPLFADPTRLAHFRQERRVLARLNHPHIARLLDAGETAEGQPYFVMEAVDGRPVDEACRGLPLLARLRLFLQLADAVAHAHRQGLVHRDLKPANVLVDAEDRVKLLDFGIADALDLARDDTVDPAAARPLTPGYASPEQVRGERVTAASDVYSLGVLLHLMVTGVRPYGLASRGTTTVAALLRAVLEDEPTRPSQAPREPDAEGGVPRRQLAGDLDAVVLKALAKPVAERYGSVDALAADLRALLERRPVAARPRTPWYVAGRFVARHRGAVAASVLALLAVAATLGAAAWQARDAAAALALVALAAGLAVSSWQARRAAQARDEARERLGQTSLLVRDVLMRYADMATYLPRGQTLKAELLADAIAHLERLHLSAPDDALLVAELAKAHARLADLALPGRDTSLERPDDALAHAERALVLFPAGERAAVEDVDFFMWWGRTLNVRARLAQHAGDPQAGHDLFLRGRRLLEGALRRLPGRWSLRHELASALLGMGQCSQTWIESSLGRSDEALQRLAEAQALFEALAAEAPADGSVPYQLGTIAGARQIVLRKLGRLEEAVAAGREAVARREQALAIEPEHTSFREGVAGEANNAAMVMLEAGLAADAEAVTARGEALMRQLEADDPGMPTWPARRRWFALHRGRALLTLGRLDEALPRLDDALLAMAGAEAGPTLGRRGWAALERARCLQGLGRATEAEAQRAEAQALLERRLAEAPDDAEAAQRLAEARALAALSAGAAPSPPPPARPAR